MDILGIEFAPLYIPLKQRLQLVAAAAYSLAFLSGGPVGLLLSAYIVFFTRFWWLCILYLIWIWIIDRDTCEKEDIHRSEWVRNWTWFKYAVDYFPITLEKVPFVELDKKRNYLFCCFPHGVMATGPVFTFATNPVGFKETFPDHKPHLCSLPQLFQMPFFRWLLFATGTRAATANSLKYILSKNEGGHALGLSVGGAAEALHCRPGHYKLVLKERKGFVKIALQHGTSLVPVITFGETDIFRQVEGTKIRMIQEWLKRWLKFAPLIIVGRGFFQYSFGIIPQRYPLHVVVGKPIDIQKIEDPTQEQITELHEKFIEQLVETFETQKKHYIKDYENVHIELT